MQWSQFWQACPMKIHREGAAAQAIKNPNSASIIEGLSGF
jgi:hypothetical protein